MGHDHSHKNEGPVAPKLGAITRGIEPRTDSALNRETVQKLTGLAKEAHALSHSDSNAAVGKVLDYLRVLQNIDADSQANYEAAAFASLDEHTREHFASLRKQVLGLLEERQKKIDSLTKLAREAHEAAHGDDTLAVEKTLEYLRLLQAVPQANQTEYHTAALSQLDEHTRTHFLDLVTQVVARLPASSG